MKSVTIAVESAPAVSFADNGVIEHVELSLLNVRREVIKKKQRYTLRQRHWDNVCFLVFFSEAHELLHHFVE